jgi:hypothetical protein
MRLILTADASSAGGLKEAGRADLVIPVELRFVWGPLPSDVALTAMLAPRTTQAPGSHWLDNVPPPRIEKFGVQDLGLIELCQRCEKVELWFEPDPNSQLVLIWLLGYLRTHVKAAIPTNLFLCHVDARLGDIIPQELAKLKFATCAITSDHFEIAHQAWQAYRAPAPQPWFDLLNTDLSILPQLRSCVLGLLAELPGRATGLGATEMRMLDLISPGNVFPFDVFPGYQKSNTRRVFAYWEVGSLLDGLARCPAPAVSGLDEGPFADEMHDDAVRHARYKQSEISLTELGQAILAQTDDFSRHNPIHRWWGGTELTNDRLWRWDPTSRTLVAR